ncbi:Uncharacterised protein [Mycolicibacterium phlei]|nr:Uncharacterised protein [Mycolicibacterium phlei]
MLFARDRPSSGVTPSQPGGNRSRPNSTCLTSGPIAVCAMCPGGVPKVERLPAVGRMDPRTLSVWVVEPSGRRPPPGQPNSTCTGPVSSRAVMISQKPRRATASPGYANTWPTPKNSTASSPHAPRTATGLVAVIPGKAEPGVRTAGRRGADAVANYSALGKGSSYLGSQRTVGWVVSGPCFSFVYRSVMWAS